MLNYTFSKREQVMLVILAIILILVAWYFLVFQNITSQISKLDGQVQEAQTTVTTDMTKVSKMKQMESTIEEAKSSGKAPKDLPSYNNLQNVIVSLNGILAGTPSYKIDFDSVDSTSSPVSRGISITFNSDNYSDAKGVIDSIANGPYFCSLDTLSITSSAQSSSLLRSATSGNYTTQIHVTYYEKK